MIQFLSGAAPTGLVLPDCQQFTKEGREYTLKAAQFKYGRKGRGVFSPPEPCPLTCFIRHGPYCRGGSGVCLMILCIISPLETRSKSIQKNQSKIKSGLLFSLAIEPLAARIGANDNISGFQYGILQEKVLLYADDMFLLLGDTEASLSVICHIYYFRIWKVFRAYNKWNKIHFITIRSRG